MRQDKGQEEEGATAAEYAIMVSLIAMFVIASVTVLGLTVEDIFTTMADLLP
jgi:Flp pilus assembly pilin Flp